MSTKKPLIELLPQIFTYIDVKYAANVDYNAKLLDIYEGQLLKYVEESMRKELSPEAFERARERIAPINLLNKVIDKLSRVYMDPASRTAENDSDNAILDKYEEWFDIDNSMGLTNRLLNLHKYFALEPYLDNGTPRLRVIPADKFLVWSDNENNPNTPTVFIKFMGTTQKEYPATDSEGRSKKDGSIEVRNIQVFRLYSDDEYMEVHRDGVVAVSLENPYGRIPFVYGNMSPFNLIPLPDSDSYNMAILIPKLLADLNYATQFQSHSIMYGIDIDPQNLSGNPDAFWIINSVEGEGKNPQLGTIKPEVDTEKVISLIETEVAMWLDSKGLKTGSNGSLNAQNASSGVAKLIDESDATAVRKDQVRLFSGFENNLWSLVKDMHNYWVSNAMVEGEGKAFTSKFKPTVVFADQKPVVDRKQVLEELKLLKDLNLFVKERALRMIFPSLTEVQIKDYLSELDRDSEDMDRSMSTFINSPIEMTKEIVEEEEVEE